MKNSTKAFLVAALMIVAYFVLQSMAFASATTEAELVAASSDMSMSWMFMLGILVGISGIVLRLKEKKKR